MNEIKYVVNQAASEVCCSLKEAETQNLSLKSQQNEAVCLAKLSDAVGEITSPLETHPTEKLKPANGVILTEGFCDMTNRILRDQGRCVVQREGRAGLS